jgi:hypothetical protein
MKKCKIGANRGKNSMMFPHCYPMTKQVGKHFLEVGKQCDPAEARETKKTR